jgi:hypothetical protein
VTPLLLPAAFVEELEVFCVCCGCCTDAVDTVICAPDDGWWYHPKHVEQFSDKVNCVALHLVGHILEYVIRIQNLKAAKVNLSALNTEHCRV